MEKEPSSWRKDAIAILSALVVLFFARASLADHYVVPTGSMEPTVAVADRVLVTKAAYGLRFPGSDTWLVRWSSPARGDVVIIDQPEPDPVLLKRVVGIPGDRVRVSHGVVEIVGVPTSSDGAHESIAGRSHAVSFEAGTGPDYGPVTLGEGQYLVLGDNRGNSRDGRAFGLVDEPRILGRASRIFYSNDAFVWRDLE